MANTIQKGLLKLGTAFAFVSAAVGLNDNKIMAQGNNPGGFTPEKPKTEWKAPATDSAKKAVKVNFNAPKSGEDSTSKKVITPNMTVDDKAAIYSKNNPAVGIAIWKGKDMAKYTDQQIIAFYEGICRDSGVVSKVFLTNELMNDGGNTTYAVFVKGGSVGGIMNGDNILSDEGLYRAIRARKGQDYRDRRASMGLNHQ